MSDTWKQDHEMEETPHSHAEYGTWAVDEVPPRSAHDVTVEAAKEAARSHFINNKINGAPLPDLEPWPAVYREAFLDELARLEAENRQRAAGG
jgi:hypothetical protein